MKVQLFVPCFIDQMASQVGVATYELLQKLGCDIVYPTRQTCCGQAASNAGYVAESKVVCNYFHQQFASSYPIVSPSASCIAYLKGNKPKNVRLDFECYELSDFLIKVLGKRLESPPPNQFSHKVAFHYSCASLRELPDAARNSLQLLKVLEGIDLIDHFSSCEECCGFGGSFSLKFNAVADTMGKRKLDNLLDTDATYVTSTDMSCLLHLDKLIQKDKLPLKVIHIAEILNQAYQPLPATC